MATSGSTDFTVTRNEIIHGALRLCGASGEGDSTSDSLVQNAAQALNLIAKSWMAHGMHVFLRSTAVVFLEEDEDEYTLKPSGDHATLSHVKTEIRVAGIATDTTIQVDSTTGMTAADYIGIELDDGTLQWTTISTVVDEDTLTIPAAGITSAAAIGNHVYTYTTRLSQMPYAILDAYLRDENNKDTPVDLIPRGDYNALSDKSSSGTITEAYYERRTSEGHLFVWQTPDTVKDRLFIEFHREVEDFDSSSDEPDFPKHFFRALKFQLAADLSPEFGISIQRMSYLEARAKERLEEALGYDKEGRYFQLVVDEDYT